LVTLPKNFWTRVLGSVVIQLYAGERRPSVDRALIAKQRDINTDEKFFASLEFDFFQIQLKFALRIRPLVDYQTFHIWRKFFSAVQNSILLAL